MVKCGDCGAPAYHGERMRDDEERKALQRRAREIGGFVTPDGQVAVLSDHSPGKDGIWDARGIYLISRGQVRDITARFREAGGRA